MVNIFDSQMKRRYIRIKEHDLQMSPLSYKITPQKVKATLFGQDGYPFPPIEPHQDETERQETSKTVF